MKALHSLGPTEWETTVAYARAYIIEVWSPKAIAYFVDKDVFYKYEDWDNRGIKRYMHNIEEIAFQAKNHNEKIKPEYGDHFKVKMGLPK